MRLGNLNLNNEKPLYFIADIASNHDGDINRAFKLIELAKKVGADAAKFQNFVAEKIVSKRGFEELKSALSHQKSWGKPVFEVYKDASVSGDWTPLLKKKCDEVGIEYFTSPYDFESVDSVDPYVNLFKIGSGDITWIEIIEYIAKKGKPVIISSGASTFEDVDRAMTALSNFNSDIVLMQCNTNYTASVENFKYINLNVLKTFAQKYPGVILGLSDHTHGHTTVLGAVALGAKVFEKHFTDDNTRSGPDHKFAMNPATWHEMVERANELCLALGNGKKVVEENEKETLILQRRSLRFTKNLVNGHILEYGDLFPLRPIPVDGIPPYELAAFIGKKLTRDVISDDFLRRKDVE
jgi:N-acetylneuraminate synthase